MLSAKIAAADGAVNKFEGSIKRAQGAANSFAASVGVAFGAAAVVAFGQKMVQAGSQVEDALTGLTTLLKDKAQAQQVINNTMEDATKTPFAFEGLLAANKALISAGVGAQAARTDVLNLANAIAATGGGDVELQRMVINMQQISNTGKATAADIKQFAFAGINIYKVLADATGQPIEKVKELDVTYEQLTMALAQAAGEGGIYADGLANMAGNTSVRISNLGDSIFQLSVKMFNDLKPAIDTVITGISSFIDVIRSAWDWTMQNSEAIKAGVITLGIATAAYQIYLLTLGQGALYTGILTAAQYALNLAMSLNPVGILIVGIAALAAGVVYAYNKFGTFRAVLWGVWGVIKAWAGLVTDIFQGVWKVIDGVMTLNVSRITEGWDQAAGAMQNSGMKLAKGFADGYNSGMKDFVADQEQKNIKAPTTVSPANIAAGGGKMAGAKAIEAQKSETKGAQGQKAVTINVTIGSLIKDFKIQTTNISEGAAKVREMVAQALVNATNDSQLIAGQ